MTRPTPPTPETGPEVLRHGWRSGPQRSALLNSAHADWARRPRARRLLVVGYLVLVLVVSAVLALPRPSDTLMGFLAAVLVVAVLVEVFLIGSLNSATRGVIDLRTRHIDERQRQQRGEAYERSYRLAFRVITVGLVALAVAAFTGHVPTRPNSWLALGHTVFALLLMLPTLVVAWSGRD
jgi:peptidoglycan/LPS O-acetylase OafA/YrhL